MRRLFLYLISFPFLSRWYGYLVRIERPRWLVRRLIALFARYYGIMMDDFAGEIGDYPSLSAFFTRSLNPMRRPLKKEDDWFLSPADSLLTVCERVCDDHVTQVKGRSYSLSALVGDTLDFSKGWRVAVFYLSPRDYHRFHLPVAATITAARRDGGRLYPVNPFSVERISDLFICNERVTLKCRSGTHEWYYVAVGAAFVGSIETIAGNLAEKGVWYSVNTDCSQLAEIGRFNMGSTIVLAVPDGWVGELFVTSGTKVYVGDRLWKTT